VKERGEGRCAKIAGRRDEIRPISTDSKRERRGGGEGGAFTASRLGKENLKNWGREEKSPVSQTHSSDPRLVDSILRITPGLVIQRRRSNKKRGGGGGEKRGERGRHGGGKGGDQDAKIGWRINEWGDTFWP